MECQKWKKDTDKQREQKVQIQQMAEVTEKIGWIPGLSQCQKEKMIR